MLPGVRACGARRAGLPSSASLDFQQRRQQSAQLLPLRPCTLSGTCVSGKRQGGKESLLVLLARHVLAGGSYERFHQHRTALASLPTFHICILPACGLRQAALL